MKKKLITLALCGIAFITYSQDVSVEKSIFGTQTGLLGVWVHNESKLSNSIALRSELGFEAGIADGDNYDKTYFVVAPNISIEPRWYYNLKKRESKSKRIDGNSGNFVSIKTSYHPDLVIVSNDDDVQFISDITIVPTWGIKRNIGAHFNYEAGFGIGYVYLFRKKNVRVLNDSDIAVNLHLRIGYRL